MMGVEKVGAFLANVNYLQAIILRYASAIMDAVRVLKYFCVGCKSGMSYKLREIQKRVEAQCTRLCTQPACKRASTGESPSQAQAPASPLCPFRTFTVCTCSHTQPVLLSF